MSALGQQSWFLLPLQSQNQQLQNASIFTSHPQKVSVLTQLQIQNYQRNFQKDLLSPIHRPQQQKQSPQLISHVNNIQMLRHENNMRHRDLPIASRVNQKVINETRNMGTSKHTPFINSLLISNNKQQQQNPSSRFKHPSPPQRFVLPQVIEQLSDIQPKLRPQTFKVPQLPVLAIVTSRPRAPEQKFVPQKLIHINSLNNRIHEPVLSSSTILIPIHTSLKREDQSATIVKNIGGISLVSANDAFLECCKEKNVDTKCESRCNFDILDRRVLTAMFIGSDPCPRNNGRSLLSCAAQDSDHTNCCRANGVQHTAAGDKCLEFCQMTPESNFQADVSMLPCWSVLKEIKQCFRLSLIEKRNIKEA
ncbi:unnamed protein product [Wuchereria bancrofti]|uniref:Domain of unknown function DB domain-containing protein n=1 Tax=Wuchereria bancrofti TaxID=6293 RepID=A0A3P7DW27_WUCBA|nr:unnamed protein product [Wuchereria bancrofti]